MKFITVLFVMLLNGIIFSGCQPPPSVRSDIENLVRQSKFIFKGTIKQLKATTMPIVPATDSTAIVKVDQVIKAPATLADFINQEITVQLRKSQAAKVGQQSIFFTNGWLYGESIAVVEVGRLESREDTTNARKKVTDAAQKIADQELQKRIARAELVIVGKVSSTTATEQAQRGLITEHEPDWWEATIQVESVEKGQIPGKSIDVLFPNSIDVMWFRSPKFKVTQESIWFLHRNQMPGLQVSGYTALDSLDVHPRDQLDRIRRLIKGIR